MVLLTSLYFSKGLCKWIWPGLDFQKTWICIWICIYQMFGSGSVFQRPGSRSKNIAKKINSVINIKLLLDPDPYPYFENAWNRIRIFLKALIRIRTFYPGVGSGSGQLDAGSTTLFYHSILSFSLCFLHFNLRPYGQFSLFWRGAVRFSHFSLLFVYQI